MKPVRRKRGEDFDGLIRRFKKKVFAAEIIAEHKKHTVYMSPGQKRRAKHDAAVRKLSRMNR
jgi:ribosomal protein S21